MLIRLCIVFNLFYSPATSSKRHRFTGEQLHTKPNGKRDDVDNDPDDAQVGKYCLRQVLGTNITT